jgi:hypothetical protein
MTDELRDRLAAAIDDAAAPVTPSEAMFRGRRQARRRTTVAVAATVIAVAVSGVAIANATTQNAARPVHVFVGNGSDAASTSVTTPTYRASETLIILAPAVSIPPERVRVQSISSVEMRNDLEALMTSEDTARAVAAAGGLAQFSFVGSPAVSSPLIKVVTTSVQRQEANRTLTIIDSVIKQKLFAMQTAAGVQAHDLFTAELVARVDA